MNPALQPYYPRLQGHIDTAQRGAGNRARGRIVRMRHHKLSSSWMTMIGMYREMDAFHREIDLIMERAGARKPTPHNVPSLRYAQVRHLKPEELAQGGVGA